MKDGKKKASVAPGAPESRAIIKNVLFAVGAQLEIVSSAAAPLRARQLYTALAPPLLSHFSSRALTFQTVPAETMWKGAFLGFFSAPASLASDPLCIAPDHLGRPAAHAVFAH